MSVPGAPFPGAQVPALGLTGLFATPWILYLAKFDAQPGAPLDVALAASPASYTASQPGTLYLVGGTISAVTFTRSGNAVSLGPQRAVPMVNGDVVTVTYTGSVSASFIPG